MVSKNKNVKNKIYIFVTEIPQSADFSKNTQWILGVAHSLNGHNLTALKKNSCKYQTYDLLSPQGLKPNRNKITCTVLNFCESN